MTDTSDLKPEHTEKATGLSTSKEVPESTLTQKNNRPLQLHRLQSVQLQQRKNVHLSMWLR